MDAPNAAGQGRRSFACFACFSQPSVYEPSAHDQGNLKMVPVKVLAQSDISGYPTCQSAIAAGYSSPLSTPTSGSAPSNADALPSSSASSERSSGGPASVGSAGARTEEDAASDYHDCLSRCSMQSWTAEEEEEHEAAAERQRQRAAAQGALVPLPGSPSRSSSSSSSGEAPIVQVDIRGEPKAPLPRWCPREPLMFNTDTSMRFAPIPLEVPYAGYWAKDPTKTTPSPWPSDVLLGGGRFCHGVKETVQGMKFTDSATTLKLQLRAQVLGMPFIYTEIFNKDNSMTTWNLRRDVAIGLSRGQCFYTTDGTFITRVWCSAGGLPAYYEDYVTSDPDGNMRITQFCKNMRNGKTVCQTLVGSPAPLPSKKNK